MGELKVFTYDAKAKARKFRWVEVFGEFEWGGIELFTHRSVDGPGFSVSERTTGWRVAGGSDVEGARSAAVSGLRSTPLTVVRKVVDDVLAGELGGVALN